jgi:hypothetical protein
MPKETVLSPPVAGPIVGVATALVMAWLLISLANLGNNALGLYPIVLGAVTVLAPLLLATIVLSFVYLRRGAPGYTFAWMWLPPLLVLVSLLVIEGLQTLQKQAIETAHPNIREVHINLSGRSLWLNPEDVANSTDGAVEMSGSTPEKFAAFTRYYGNYYGTEDKMAAYNVARLADSFREMRIFYGQPANTQPSILPVNRASAFPDLTTFIDRLSFKGGEASVIGYWYYHYLEHVDVVPAISLSGSQSMDLWGSGVPLPEFHIANLGTQPIARIEINGQAIALGSEAFRPEGSENSSCTSRNFQTYAVSHLDAPLKLRWQLAQTNPSWHQASVVVPEFSSGQSPIAQIRSTSVELYFQADGSVVAERSQVGELSQGKLAIRTTGPAEPLLSKPPCGFAPDRFSEEVTVIRN